MPKPIFMTDAMIDECFADVRKEFETLFAKALERAKSGKEMLAKGAFSFPSVTYDWTDDKTRAKIVIDPTAYSKMLLLMFGSDKEIGWHGFVTRDAEDPNVFHIEDVLLFPQEVTSVTVQTDDTRYKDWLMDLPDDQFNKVRFHGHSHVNMGTTPSTTDLTYYASLIQQFKKGFYVFMIMNKRFEHFCQVYDFDNNSMFENSEIDVIVGDDFAAKLEADKKEMVATKTYQYGGYGNYGGRYGSGYGGYNHAAPSHGTYKKDDTSAAPPKPAADPKAEKKDDAGSASNAGGKSDPSDGQSALSLPPYYDNDDDGYGSWEDPWYYNQKGRAV